MKLGFEMHGLLRVFGRGRTVRLLTVLVATGLVQAGAAQAAITQTAITSPSDPSYYYDPTGGAAGGFTVTGRTNSTDPSADAVDIDCYSDNGSDGTYEYTVVGDVSLDATNGSFSTPVTYAELETSGSDFPNPNVLIDVIYNPDDSACQLRAVPTGQQPASGLAAYAGPRVLLAYLATEYSGQDGTSLSDYTLVAPQPGATNIYTDLTDCGVVGTYLNDDAVFGQSDDQGFNCADTSAGLNEGTGELEVDGAPAAPNNGAGSDALTISAVQNPTDGDMTIREAEPLADKDGVPDGVQLTRTIQQTASGHVVLVTDSFSSTDGGAHTVVLNAENQACFLAEPCGQPYGDNFDADQVEWQLPDDAGYQTDSHYPDGANPAVDSSASFTTLPATVHVANPTAGVYGAITYFTAPYSDGNFTFQEPSSNPGAYYEDALGIPYVLSVPAGGAAPLTIAYVTDSSQPAVNSDITAAEKLEAAGAPTPPGSTVPTTTTPGSTPPPPVTVAGSTQTSSTSTTTATSVAPAKVTAYVGPTYHPIANTLGASRHGHTSERLNGEVIPGSGDVTYFFQYGTTKRYGHRSQIYPLTAGESVRDVTLTLKKLVSGKTYHYRVVAIGADGDAIGADRTFRAARS